MKYILSILISMFAANSFSQGGFKNFIDLNYIEVTGVAEKEVTPDQIYLKIVVNEADSKGKQTLEELEKAMIKKLTAIGIDVKKDLVIVDMASNFKNYWLKNKDIYSMKEYQVECKDARTAGSVFQELESLGISNISIERVDHSELDKFREEVKVAAIVAAKQKADALSGAINQSIGKAIYILEQDYQLYKTQANMQMSAINIRGYSDAESMPMPEIEFEKIKLEYTIRVSFELK
ncbi:MAG: SIMPL domain-containing protein [Bacteroidales bacterium]